MNLNIDYGLCMIMTWQCRFTNCNKRTPLVGNVDNRADSACMGTESYMENIIPSQYCCEYTSALKN